MTERYALDDHLGDRVLLVAASYLALLRGEGAEREVLLHLRSGTGYMDDHWALLAGHVDTGESAHAAAVREAGEEAGVVVDEADLVALTALHRLERGGPQVEQRADFFFATSRWSGEPHVVEPDKCADMRWVRLLDLDGLPGPVVPHERMVLDHLAAGTLPPVISLVR